MLPRLSTVIVSFNTRDLLRRCLASIVDSHYHVVVRAEGGMGVGEWGTEDSLPSPIPHPPTPIPTEIIVVDNASSDGSLEMVREEFPEVRLVPAGRNLGFAAATNIGLRAARGQFLLLLNPDTELLDDALVQMASFLAARPDVAAVGPSLVYPDGRPQHSAFRFPTLAMVFLDLFPLHRRLLDSRLNGRYGVPEDGAPFPIDHPLGAAMMLKRQALDKIGPLDEGFFMYCEEVDWCIRARRCGWDVFCVPSARIVHHSGQSTGQLRDAMFVELYRSRHRLYDKHYPRRFIAVNRIIVRAGLAWKTLEARRRAARGEIDTEELSSRLEAYRAIRNM